MKRFLTILALCALTLTAVACENNTVNTKDTSTGSEYQSTDRTIGNSDTEHSDTTDSTGIESNVTDSEKSVVGVWNLIFMRFDMDGYAFDMSIEESLYDMTYIFDADGKHDIISTERASGISSSDFSENVIVTYTYENNTITVASIWDATIEAMRALLEEKAEGLSDEEVRAMFCQIIVYTVDFEDDKLLLTTIEEDGGPVTYVLVPAS